MLTPTLDLAPDADIDVAWLRRRKACDRQVVRFFNAFGSGRVTLTHEALLKAALHGLDLAWFISNYYVPQNGGRVLLCALLAYRRPGSFRNAMEDLYTKPGTLLVFGGKRLALLIADVLELS